MKEQVQQLLHDLRVRQFSREEEEELRRLAHALDVYFFEKDYQVLAPRNPDDDHPMAAEATYYQQLGSNIWDSEVF